MNVRCWKLSMSQVARLFVQLLKIEGEKLFTTNQPQLLLFKLDWHHQKKYSAAAAVTRTWTFWFSCVVLSWCFFCALSPPVSAQVLLCRRWVPHNKYFQCNLMQSYTRLSPLCVNMYFTCANSSDIWKMQWDFLLTKCDGSAQLKCLIHVTGMSTEVIRSFQSEYVFIIQVEIDNNIISSNVSIYNLTFQKYILSPPVFSPPA